MQETRNAFSRMILLLVCCTGFYSTGLHAAPSEHAYYIDEPVFGGRVLVREAGRDNRTLIVLVHGLGNLASRTWDDVIPKLSERFHVLSFDLPGFGRSDKANHLYSPDNYVRFIDYLVERTGKEKSLMVGHSLGGNIALRYAITHPQKVERLMLVDAAGILHRLAYTNFLVHFGIDILPQFYPQQSDDLRSITSTIIGEIAAQSGLLEYGERYVLTDPGLRQSILGGEPSAIAAYAMIMTDYTGQLKDLTVPTLILWGRDDQVIPVRTARVLATNIPASGMVLFDGIGHNPIREIPGRFYEWLNRFASASRSGFARLVENTRYRIEQNVSNNSQRDLTCRNEREKFYVGDFDKILIENCQDVVIDSARISQIKIINSKVTVNNSIIRSSDMAVSLTGSQVEINGARIYGLPAISMNGSGLDIAGSMIVSRSGPAIRHNPETGLSSRPDLNPRQSRTTLLFSISHLLSNNTEREMHGPVNLVARDQL